jgi:hypothetical protein
MNLAPLKSIISAIADVTIPYALRFPETNQKDCKMNGPSNAAAYQELHAGRAARATRQFKVFIYKDNGSTIENELDVVARSMYEARKQFLDQGVAAHRIYALDVTK